MSCMHVCMCVMYVHVYLQESSLKIMSSGHNRTKFFKFIIVNLLVYPISNFIIFINLEVPSVFFPEVQVTTEEI